jgi:transcriptional regulator with XRE-family HTH domain
MALKGQAVESPGVGGRIRQLLLERQMQGREPSRQLSLAKASGISRQTLSIILNSDRITENAADAIARAFGVPLATIAPEHAGGRPLLGSVREPFGIYTPAASQAVRLFLARLQAELIEAGASDEEIRAAVSLVTSPEVLIYCAGGNHHDLSDAERLKGMESVVQSLIRPKFQKAKKAGK